jgi:hypothetical protein
MGRRSLDIPAGSGTKAITIADLGFETWDWRLETWGLEAGLVSSLQPQVSECSQFFTLNS